MTSAMWKPNICERWINLPVKIKLFLDDYGFLNIWKEYHERSHKKFRISPKLMYHGKHSNFVGSPIGFAPNLCVYLYVVVFFDLSKRYCLHAFLSPGWDFSPAFMGGLSSARAEISARVERVNAGTSMYIEVPQPLPPVHSQSSFLS